MRVSKESPPKALAKASSFCQDRLRGHRHRKEAIHCLIQGNRCRWTLL